MEFIYSTHAVQRMIERSITTADVEAVITKADGSIPQSRDKKIFYKRMRHRKDNLIAVVAVQRSSELPTEIITVLVNFEVRT